MTRPRVLAPRTDVMMDHTREQRAFAAELKFLVAPDLGDAIRDWARVHLSADPHGTGDHHDAYTTTSLYTDTSAQDVYRKAGSYGRSKYRIRRYGVSDVAFLERKLRTRSLLSKRRTPVPVFEVPRLLESPEALEGWNGAWFARRVAARHLAPVCQVSYDRVARVTQTPYGLARLTVDSGLRARVNTTWGFSDGSLTAVLDARCIVEMKFLVAMPAVFKRALMEFGLEPMTVSKYRLSVEGLGLTRRQVDPMEVA